MYDLEKYSMKGIGREGRVANAKGRTAVVAQVRVPSRTTSALCPEGMIQNEVG